MTDPVAAMPPAGLVARLVAATGSVPLPSERLVRILIPVVVITVAILTVTPWPIGAYQDDAMYAVLAKSLAEGHGFKFINLPGEPNATHFPPGYPLVLAAIWKLWPAFPDNIVAFKFLNALFLGLAALGAYHFTRRRFAAPMLASAAVALIGTLSIVVLLVTGVVMSEPMFLALLFPALLVAERAVDHGRWQDALLAGLLLGALSMVRTLGVFAVPALGFVLLFRRHVRQAVVMGAAAAVFLVPWQLWVMAHEHEVAPVFMGKYGSYGTWLVDGYRLGGFEFAWSVIRINVLELEGMLSYYFMPVQGHLPRALVFVPLFGLALLGMERFRRNAPASLWFLVLYTIIVMLWPFEPARFVVALWPMWPLLVGCGLVTAWQWLGQRPRRAALAGRSLVIATVAAFVAGSGFYNAVGYTRQWWVTTQEDAGKRAKPIVEWAARYTDSTTVLSTTDDLIVYLYAGRKSVPTSTFLPSQRVRQLTDPEDVEVVRDIFKSYDPAWFIVGSQQAVRTARTLSAGTTPELRPVGRTPDALIFQRLSK